MVVIVSAAPSQPSEITGSTSVCPNETGLVYSVTNVAGVEYNWSLPSGWTPTAGAGTNSITVTAGTAGGTISVTPSNGCGNGTARTLAVTAANCSVAIPASGAGITTFTNVMYDFQHQTLEAYKGSGGGDPTTFQWQYSTTTADASFVAVPNAPNSAFYTIPADFANSYLAGSTHSATLYFRCLLSNPATPTPVKTPNMNILFINTTTGGYGELNGVKFLTLGKGSGGKTVAGGSTATLNVALLNLGQSSDWDGNSQTITGLPPVYTPNNDAGDLGDFYQWGRVADGHQKNAWSKNASHINQIAPMNGVTTSAVVAYSSLASNAATAAANYDAYSQSNTTPYHQVKSSSGGYGKFIFVYNYGSTGNCVEIFTVPLNE
jgi:hypothetical protein